MARRGVLLGAGVIGFTASPCLAQAAAQTTATVVIQEPVSATIAADFISQNGIALSLTAPSAGPSSVAVSIASAPTSGMAGTAPQDRLLSISAAAFKGLIPISSVVSIIDTRLLFDSAQINGGSNLLLVLLQYN